MTIWIIKVGMEAPLPLPPKTCISICSSRHITNVLTWGSNPKRKITGKHKANTGGETETMASAIHTIWEEQGKSCKTYQWAYPWHWAGNLQRRKWLHRARKIAGFQSRQTGQRSKSSHSTSRSRLADCTQWSNYGPVKWRNIIIRIRKHGGILR